MYMVTRRYEGVSPKLATEGTRQIKEGFLPILRQVKGFLTYDLLDAGNGVLCSVSTFESQSGAEEATRKTAEWIKQNLAPMIPQAPQVTGGEAIIHESRQPTTVR